MKQVICKNELEYHLATPDATILDLGFNAEADEPQQEMFRIYCFQNSILPENYTFNIQIRTHKGIGKYGTGKPRNMYASVGLTLGDLRSILAWAEKHAAG